MDKIKVLNSDLKALGSTSKAFNVEKVEELMREYTLSFSIVNNDAVFKYIGENNVFKYHGQYFDISGIDGDSGNTNITQVTAEHISYRMADYTLPNGYSFVGTVREIAEDILREAKTVDETPANTVFSIGETADLGTRSFSLSGAKNVTAREALIAMSKLGVEVSFDNFTANLPERIGTEKGVTFRYGVNLSGVHRTWQRGNGWNYEINIADLQKALGGDEYSFGIGDDITVEDSLSGITINSRIISYTECDDPTQNHVTVGVFVRDNASLTIETDRIANTAKETADNSVQQGEKYSNVSISHENGFMATNKAGTQRVMMNGDDCFVVQVLQNGKWVTVNSLEAFGLLIDRITSQLSKDSFYIKVGKTNNGEYGLSFFIDNQESFTISSRKSGFINLFSPKFISIETNQGFKIESTAYDAMSKISGRNIQITTGNLIIKDSDKNISGSGRTEKIKFVTKNDSGESYVREFQVIQGILTI